MAHLDPHRSCHSWHAQQAQLLLPLADHELDLLKVGALHGLGLCTQCTSPDSACRYEQEGNRKLAHLASELRSCEVHCPEAAIRVLLLRSFDDRLVQG